MGRLSGSLVNKARNGKCAPGRYRDGANGLILSVSKSGAASWLMRFQLHGRRRDAGLGSVHHVGLAKARELAAAKVGTMKADRVDPLEARTTARAEQRQRSATFDQMSAAYIAAHSPSWKNAKHAGQWKTTLAKYASPVIGRLPASEVTTAHVLQILEKIWHKTPDTASRLRARIELVLDYARAQGFRREDSANPARWRGHLQTLLPAIGQLKKTKHHASGRYRRHAGYLCHALQGRHGGGVGPEILFFDRLEAVRSHQRDLGRNRLARTLLDPRPQAAQNRQGAPSTAFRRGVGRPTTGASAARQQRRARVSTEVWQSGCDFQPVGYVARGQRRQSHHGARVKSKHVRRFFDGANASSGSGR